MVNILNQSLSISEQRESLLKDNLGEIYGVYSLDDSDGELSFTLIENVMTCYENQFEKLKSLDESPDITIIDIKNLMKGDIEPFKWEKVSLSNPVLLSSRVIELFKTDWENSRYHLSNILRDGGSVNKWKRSTIAWRCVWNNLEEDLNREYSEESPFLWYDENWNFAFSVPNTSKEAVEFLKKSVKSYIETKILSEWDENYETVKVNFERNFPWIKYSELKDVLLEIIENERFIEYSSNDIGSKIWIDSEFKTVSLWESQWEYYVYRDNENNTFEYSKVLEIKNLGEWFTPLSNRPSRLFLKSQNQYPRIPRIENATEWHSPAVAHFSKKINDILSK